MCRRLTARRYPTEPPFQMRSAKDAAQRQEVVVADVTDNEATTK